MPLHLLKLCVGADSVEDLRAWTAARAQARLRSGLSDLHAHVTRMTPSRGAELLDGGSLYWVIKGQISARQKLLGLETFVDSAGIKRCALQLDDDIVNLRPRPCRAFQGWRYLKDEDAPPDLDAAGAGLAEMPEDLRRQLSDLGLL